MTLDELGPKWESRADALAPYAPAAAEAFRRAARELATAIAAGSSASLSLTEAAARSGFHADSIGRMIRRGALTNVGTPARPRVLVAELPTKPAAGVAHKRLRAATSTTTSPASAELTRDAVAGRIRRT